MKKFRLTRPYLFAKEDGEYSWGGSQMWFDNKMISQCGCGLIGSADVLLYLRRMNQRLSKESYQRYIQRLRKWFWIWPGFGMNGWMLALHFNLWSIFHGFSFRAFWGVRKKKQKQTIQDMLQDDIPVIFAVGPNLPWILKKQGLQLYCKSEQGFAKAQTIRGHFMVITEMAGEWMEVSSWGKRYYINWKEYEEYVKKYSCSLFSNICRIKR